MSRLAPGPLKEPTSKCQTHDSEITLIHSCLLFSTLNLLFSYHSQHSFIQAYFSYSCTNTGDTSKALLSPSTLSLTVHLLLTLTLIILQCLIPCQGTLLSMLLVYLPCLRSLITGLMPCCRNMMPSGMPYVMPHCLQDVMPLGMSYVLPLQCKLSARPFGSPYVMLRNAYVTSRSTLIFALLTTPCNDFMLTMPLLCSLLMKHLCLSPLPLLVLGTSLGTLRLKSLLLCNPWSRR